MNCRNKAYKPLKIDRSLKLFFKNALKEDIGIGDITSRLIAPKGKKAKAYIILKEKGVIAGIDAAKEIFKIIDKNIKFRALCRDGDVLGMSEKLAIIEGDCRVILACERTALNLLSHLSGIATLTQKFARKIKPYKTKIYDTRKTIPGLRCLEKYSVTCGGGYNHRLGLWDMILIKDNHLALTSRLGLNINDAVRLAKSKKPNSIRVEVEVKNFKEFKEALSAKPDIIMLDNMNLKEMKKAVRLKGPVKIEASGSVNLSKLKRIAKTGVDIISAGALTHSAPALDMSLELA